MEKVKRIIVQGKPGDPKPALKNSFVTKVGDLYCGVGYYK